MERPAPITGGWLPANPSDRLAWLEGLIDSTKKKERDGKLEEENDKIKALRKLIQENAVLSMLFTSMFDEIPYTVRLNPVGGEYKVCL
jgi:hypothetical protein